MARLRSIAAASLLIAVAAALDEGTRVRVGVRAHEPGSRQIDLVRFLHYRGVSLHRGLTRVGPAEPGDVLGAPPTEPQVRAVAEPIMDELSSYPPAFFNAGILDRIILVRGLARGDEALAGTIRGMDRTLYLDAENGTMHPSHLRRTVHHELFHLMDYVGGHLAEDAEWEALSGSVGYAPALAAFEVLQGASEPRENPPGFVSLYARTSVAEDKAELYEFLIMDGDYVEGRCGWDRMLADKVHLLGKRLEEGCRALDARWIASFRRPGIGRR